MKIWITLIFSLILGTTYAQKVEQDSVQDYYTYQYTKDLYEYEKNKLIWSVAGSAAMTIGNVVNYYRYGQSGYAYFGGLSLGFNLYSIGRLIHLNRKIKKMEHGKSSN